MPTHLLPCTSCARHVRITEPLCPFCGEMTASFERETRVAEPPPGLDRAALYSYRLTALRVAAGAALLAAAACDAGRGSPQATAYGAPAPMPPTLSVDASSPPDAESSPDGANLSSEVYGGPPHHLDAGAPAVPAYGAPPPDPRR